MSIFLVLMVLLISGCSVKRTEQIKEQVKDKSETKIDEDVKGSKSETLTNFGAITIDTSSSTSDIITITEVENVRDSSGTVRTKIRQTRTERNKSKLGINQSLNGTKLELKRDSTKSTRTNIKNDINRSTKTKETASSSSNGWFNLLWFFVPLGLIIYWRFFRGK